MIEFVKLENGEVPNLELKEVGVEKAINDKDAVIIVSRASEYCLDNNDNFQDDGNKSFPHDGLVCVQCSEPVVISNRMWDVKQKNSDAKVLCLRCLPEFIKKNESNEQS